MKNEGCNEVRKGVVCGCAFFAICDLRFTMMRGLTTKSDKLRCVLFEMQPVRAEGQTNHNSPITNYKKLYLCGLNFSHKQLIKPI